MQPHRVDAEHAGTTLASALRRAEPGLPWSKARVLCERGKVRVNGELALDPARRLVEGDRVELDRGAPDARVRSLTDDAVKHFDRQVIVIEKPAGLMTVPFDESEVDTLISRAQTWLRRREGAGLSQLHAVQRLDKDTTGLLVFARTLAARKHLQRQFRVHSVERRYLAIAHGLITRPRTIESDLLADRGDGLRGSYGHFRKPKGPLPREAQHAVTHVTPRDPLRGATLIECRLETGRQHQIRIHLAELGHPLLGEPVYIRDYQGPKVTAPRPMLHAAVLGFVHPGSEQPVRWESPLPADFAKVLERLRR
jgi:23S rRNA pseudouridine1911/1915/1917 synthase